MNHDTSPFKTYSGTQLFSPLLSLDLYIYCPTSPSEYADVARQDKIHTQHSCDVGRLERTKKASKQVISLSLSLTLFLTQLISI